MTLNGSYLIFLYVCEYLRTILPHTNCMKMWRIIVMWVWPTSLQGITLGHKNKHCNINKVICYSCDGKGDTKTADKGVLQTKASRGSVILLSLMNKNTRTVVIMNTVNDGRCISKNRSVISIAPSSSQQFILLRACSLQPSFSGWYFDLGREWAVGQILWCSGQFLLLFFFLSWVLQQLLSDMMWDKHLPCGHMRWGCLKFDSK